MQRPSLRRRAALLSAVATIGAATLLAGPISPAHADSTVLEGAPYGDAFLALASPVRLVDTRSGQVGALEQPTGSIGSDVTTPLAANTTVRFVVAGANGIPADAVAIAFNVTAVQSTGTGYLTAFPCASTATAAPATSTLNFGTSAIANSAILAHSGGGVCVRASRQVHVILDTTGYFGSNFIPLSSPTRLFDTRSGQVGALEQPTGSYGSDITTPMQANVARRFVVADTAGLPVDVGGLALNVTVVAPAAGGYMKVYPCATVGDAAPATSTINFSTATVANGALIAPAANGGLCVVSSVAVNAILDVSGYLPWGFEPIGPTRLLDTRPGQLGELEQPGEALGEDVGSKLTAGVPVMYPITPPGLGSWGLALNITVVAPSAPGYIKVYPCYNTATPPPATSTANYSTANAANGIVITPSPQGGSASVTPQSFSFNDLLCVVSSQSIHLIIDLLGSFRSATDDPFLLEDLAPTGLTGTFTGIEDVSASGRWAAGKTFTGSPIPTSWRLVRLDRLTDTVVQSAAFSCESIYCENTLDVGVDNAGTVFVEGDSAATYWPLGGVLTDSPTCDLPLTADVVSVQVDSFFQHRCSLVTGNSTTGAPVVAWSDNGRFVFQSEGSTLLDMTNGTTTTLPAAWNPESPATDVGCEAVVHLVDDGGLLRVTVCDGNASWVDHRSLAGVETEVLFSVGTDPYTSFIAPDGIGIFVDGFWMDTRTEDGLVFAECVVIGGHVLWQTDDCGV